ncbi:MAG TPA: UDP-3-O-(3-hydroxymyristoyl)glucosamine N-acyltransferase [Longimicrobiaceae bacterium]|nr:UDP-3-O-(3-hydroxymyristoyl)glucosamine N-acyltransferase [Longimicrobiaceae bacterium]
MPELSVAEISSRVGGEVHGDPERLIRGVAPLESAGPDELSLLTTGRYVPRAKTTRAGAVLLPRDLPCELPEDVVGIVVPDPHVALARILSVLYPERREPPGIHPTALVAADAELGVGVRIEAYAVIGDGVRIGNGVRIGAHAVLGDRCRVGADTVIHPHVTLYPGVEVGERCIVHSGARLGADGFRFIFMEGAHRKVPQVGGCRIGNDVEIGANTTIDRGSPGDTVIGDGSKIDNLVQIGHNVRLGRHVLVIAQVGISGSTTVGDGAVLGGQAGTVSHVTIGAGARVGARAGVTADIPPGETVSGNPARPHREAMRAQAALFRLPALMKRIQEIERVVLRKEPSSGEQDNGPE